MITQTIKYPFMNYHHLSKEIEIEYVGKRKWKVVNAFEYHIDRTNITIVIPKNFKTDKASIPRIAFSLFPRSVTYDFASIIHDYLYSKGMFDRKTCDLIFKDILCLVETPKWKRDMMYKAVRLGGFFAYNRKK